MKIAISVLGSTGDVQPFLALGQELFRRGHEVRFCTVPMYRSKVEACKLEFYPTAPHITEQDINQMMADTFGTIRVEKAVNILLSHLVLRDADARFRDCMAAIEGCDFVICHHIDIVGQEAAIKSQIPWISTVLCPDALPTSFQAPSFIFRLNFGRVINRLLWTVLDKLIKAMTRKQLDNFLVSIGSPRRNIGIVPLSPNLNLLGASRHIGFVFPDVEKKVVATGCWFLEETNNFTPSEELRRFLEDGPPPVVVTFGSMGGRDGGETGMTVAEAIKRAGLRAIVQKGWGGVAVSRDPRFLSVDYVPHSYLFKQAMCIVHHGGAGTTAAACRAGKPSIIVPHAGDQYYWARCLSERGVAPRMLLRGFLTSRRLEWRLRQVKEESRFVQAANEMGEKVRAENGLAVAADAIEDWAKF